MKTTMLATLGCLCVTALPVFAADSEGNFAIEGVGVAKCSDFVTARDDLENPVPINRFLGWLEGYFTATNLFEDDTFDLMPWGPTGMLEIVVANQCEAEPDSPFMVAVQIAAAALGEQRLQVASNVVAARDGEQQVQVYSEILRRAQGELVARGFYVDAPDGLYGPATRDAIISFQTAEGLDPTGLPDPSTIWLLLLPLGPDSG